MIDFSKLNITTITKTVWKILQLLTYIFNELKKNIFWILMFNNYWDFNFWKTILRNRNHMMKEIIFKDFNKFDLTIDMQNLQLVRMKKMTKATRFRRQRNSAGTAPLLPRTSSGSWRRCSSTPIIRTVRSGNRSRRKWTSRRPEYRYVPQNLPVVQDWKSYL